MRPRLPLVLSVVVLALTACLSAEEPMHPVAILTYEEFRAQAYVEADTGYFIVNGDELVESEFELQMAYSRYVDSSLAAAETNEREQALVVHQVAGVDAAWTPAAALNITYCIDTKGFGNNAQKVIDALNAAAANWEGTANVNFIHDATVQSRACKNTNETVVFNVRQVRNAGYYARAFFPSSSRAAREILIDTSCFGNLGAYTLAGVLTHELGHTLGFRHEHTRPDAGTCFEDNSWRALTAYDAQSAMHYPQCNGTNQGDLLLTALDREGARLLYP